MKYCAVVLARSSSRRLPNKHFLLINDKKVIDYIVDKLLLFMNREQIIIATSNNKEDDQFSIYANEKNINIYRGSLENVAERFYKASLNFDYAIRINGDNVFLDSHLVEHTIKIIEQDNFDIITNQIGKTYPSGLTIEAFNVRFFKESLVMINTRDDWREHVSKYFYDNYDNFEKNTHVIMNKRNTLTNNMKISLDDEMDYELLKKIAKKFTKPHIFYEMEDIYEIYMQIK